MRKGAVYQSYGRKYADQASISALTLKKFNPWLETAIFTDDPAYIESHHPSAFDFVFPLMDDLETTDFVRVLKDTNRLFCIKIPASRKSPFDQTLLIDSDTVILTDLSHAFSKLNEFDIIACEEVENIVDESNGGWKVIGLANDRRPNYFNSGVMFLNTGSALVRDFLKEWQHLQLHGGPILEVNDQETLNYMIYNPTRFMEGIRFSGTALRTRQVNAFCRFWQEIREAGRWSEVAIVHTWLSDIIGRRVLDGIMDWDQFLAGETGPGTEYIKKCSIGLGALLPEAKQSVYAAIGERNISFAQYTNHRLRTGHIDDPIALAADLYGLNHPSVRYDAVSAVAALKNGAKRPVKTVNVIGVLHQYPDLPLETRARYYSVGSDLEFYSEAFGARVIGYCRMSFVSYTSSLCSTEHVEYAAPSFAWAKIGERVDIIIDADPSQPVITRIENFSALKNRISGGGQYAFLGISETDMKWIRENARDRWRGQYRVDLVGGHWPKTLILQALS